MTCGVQYNATDIPMPENIFINPKDLIGTLIDFLEYCKVENSRNMAVQSEMF
jgi:hypothetical protein